MKKPTRTPKPIIQGEWRAHARRHRRQPGLGDEHYWVARCRTGGQDRQVSLGWHLTSRSARDALLQLVRREGPRPSARTRNLLVDMIPAFLKATHSSRGSQGNKPLRPSSVWNRRYAVEVRFRPWLEKTHPSMRVNEFGEQHFIEYADHLRATTSRLGSPFKPNTLQGLLRTVHAFLYFCQRKGYRTVPTPPTPVIETQDEHAPRPRRVSDEDLRAISFELAKLDPRGPMLLELLRITGCRPSEALNLRRDCLRSEESKAGRDHFIEIRSNKKANYKVKTRSSNRSIWLPEKLWRRLHALAPEDNSPIFQTTTKSHYHYWQERLKKAAKAAGVPKPQFRDFRNTRAAEHVRNGTPVNVYCAVMGHSPRIGLQHYAKATLNEQAEAMRGLPAPEYGEE